MVFGSSIAWSPTAQQKMMIDFIDVEKDRFYIMGDVFRYRGTLDTRALRDALLVMIQRHDVLRAVYDASGQFVVRHTPQDAVDNAFSVVDSVTDADSAVRHIRAALGADFDLTQEVPIRVRVWASAEDLEFVIGVAVHHLAFDAWSQMLLYEGISEEYVTLMTGDGTTSTVSVPQYRDLGEIPPAPSALAAWADVLDQKYSAVRAVDSRAVLKTGPASQRHREWEGLAEAVKRTARAHKVSPFVVGSAAFAFSVADALGDTQVIFGSAHAGRTNAAEAEALGYFATSMFIGVDTASGDQAVLREIAATVRRWNTGHRIQWEHLLNTHEATDLYPLKFAFQPEALANRQLRIAGSEGMKVRSDRPPQSARRPLNFVSSYDHTSVRATATARTDALSESASNAIVDGFALHLLRLAAHDRPEPVGTEQ